jgi:hypothetical protein
MSERWAVGRDRPHSTGVESAIQTVSYQKSLSAASSRDDLPGQRQRGPQPFVVTGLSRQVRKAAAQMADGEPDPPVLAVKPRQRLRDRQADQLGLAQPDRVARPAVFHQHVVDLHVQCRHEGVQISVHEGLRARRLGSNADLGHPRPLRHVTTRPMINKESLV